MSVTLAETGQTGAQPADSLEREPKSSRVISKVCYSQENANLPAFTFSGL